jgi:hypothetical protein
MGRTYAEGFKGTSTVRSVLLRNQQNVSLGNQSWNPPELSMPSEWRDRLDKGTPTPFLRLPVVVIGIKY